MNRRIHPERQSIWHSAVAHCRATRAHRSAHGQLTSRLIWGTARGDVAALFGRMDAAHGTAIPVVSRDVAYRVIDVVAAGRARGKDVAAVDGNARSVAVPDHVASIVNAIRANVSVSGCGAF